MTRQAWRVIGISMAALGVAAVAFFQDKIALAAQGIAIHCKLIGE